MEDKSELRRRMRATRRDHVAALPDSVRALLFMRPPGPVAELAAKGSTVGLYSAHPVEAPTLSYASWFFENGRTLALPWFEDRDAPMEFRAWENPFDEDALETGPFGILQPAAGSATAVPHLAMVPLLAFTEDGIRLGQGGGHYDRWLEANPGTIPVGMAWDCQLVDELPAEPHDVPLHAVVTPTRLYLTTEG